MTVEPQQPDDGDVVALIARLRRLDIQLWADGSRLRCSAPPGALTPALRAALAAHKDALLAFLQRAAAPSDLPLPAPSTRAAAPADAPLSFAQERLWLVEQLAPGLPTYHIPAGVRLRGRLHVAALRAGLRDLIARHQVLRTTIALADGRPVQRLGPPRAVLPLLDLAVLPGAARDRALATLADRAARDPFELSRGPLLRAGLVRLAADEHVLLLTLHHLIADGWSVGLLIGELATHYAARADGRAADLAPLRLHYAEYAAWQRDWLGGAVREAQLAYWRRQLSGAPDLLQLPTDRPRPPAQSYQGAAQTFLIPAGLAGALKALSYASRSTLFIVLMAGFNALLHRYSGQADIVVGTPIAGRNRAELEPLIGFFVNTLALRADLSGDPSFAELLGRVRESTLEAHAHQDLPFEQLVEEIKPRRDLGRHPLFQALFALQNAPMPDLELPGLTIEHLDASTGTAKFDLALTLTEYPHGLAGAAEYSTDLFNGTTISRMIRHFTTLLAGCVADPTRRISALPLLAPAERRQILAEWNDSAPGVRGQGSGVRDQDACLHELFAAQAARTPDAVALVFDDEGRRTKDEGPATSGERPAGSFVAHVTYSVLDRRANQLARRLRALGAGPETLVALRLERSIALVVGVLGVLKAGAAYVPIDPAYPPERIRFMLEDSGACVIVTKDQGRRTKDESANSSLVTRSSALVDLATGWPAIAAERADRLDSRAAGDSLAYVIYTSGSTGTPKGVAVSHASAARLFGATRDWYHFDATDVWTLFHSYAFDFSVWELWGSLLHGGRLVIAPYWVSRAPGEFRRLLRDQRVTVLNQTPSAFRQLLNDADGAPPLSPTLRYVIFGGEALDIESVGPWLASGGSARAVNMYGITETTVHATYRPLTPADLGPRAGSPIGRRLPDLSIYVLDRRMQPVPIGIPGELYIGGAGLARGYLRRPDLTAAAFVPNPFTQGSGVSGQGSGPAPRSPIPDPRLYRTGDLARYLPGGEIEYLGRIDQQVKLRGFRVELGEVAAALRAHPAVRDAVALLREDRDGDQRLVAYVVTSDELRVTSSPDASCADDPGDLTKDERRMTNDDMAPSSFVLRPSSLATELRGWLAARLPDYMIPAAFVALGALPLTANGKLDRRALPAPDPRPAAQDGVFATPQTPVERTLAAIWAETLGLEQVGLDDDFFALGGHSLSATRALIRLNRALGANLTIRALFLQPTIRRLAASIDSAPDPAAPASDLDRRIADLREQIEQIKAHDREPQS